MQRFLHVRGKPGVPVSNPHTPNDPMRFVGQKNTGVPHDPKVHDALMDVFEPVDEVILDHPDLAKPIRKGDLILLDKVGMRSLDKAREHFAKPAQKIPAPKMPVAEDAPPRVEPRQPPVIKTPKIERDA